MIGNTLRELQKKFPDLFPLEEAKQQKIRYFRFGISKGKIEIDVYYKFDIIRTYDASVLHSDVTEFRFIRIDGKLSKENCSIKTITINLIDWIENKSIEITKTEYDFAFNRLNQFLKHTNENI